MTDLERFEAKVERGFQAALQDYHHNGGSSARVARAALKAIGEE
jgi:hypothetical protein